MTRTNAEVLQRAKSAHAWTLGLSVGITVVVTAMFLWVGLIPAVIGWFMTDASGRSLRMMQARYDAEGPN